MQPISDLSHTNRISKSAPLYTRSSRLRVGLKIRFWVARATGLCRRATSPPGLSAAGCRRARAGSPFHPLSKQALTTINCNGGRAESGLSSARRKTAFALKSNVLLLLERYGLERMGFLTLTFARHVVDYRKAQTAPHSLMSGVLKRRHPEYIIVLERMDSQRVHYHLLLVVAEDIRTGLNFAAVQAGDDRSASAFSSARNK